jgi:arsenate reductase
MVEVCLKSLLDESTFSVFSAGIEAHGINPYMKRAMEKLNYSLEGHTSNTMDEYENMHFDYVLTVCDHANNNCPYFKDATHLIHHSFEDPADVEGTDEQKMLVYEKVRDEIIEYCKKLVEEL